jgi:hypothetical protein
VAVSINCLTSQFDDRLAAIGIDTFELDESALGKGQRDHTARLRKFPRPAAAVFAIHLRVSVHFYIKNTTQGWFLRRNAARSQSTKNHNYWYVAG